MTGRLRQILSSGQIGLMLAGLLLLGALLSPDFLTTNNLRNLLNQSSILGILALAQFLVVLIGGFDLSVGAILALSSVIVAVLAPQHSLGVASIAGIGAGAALGLLSGVAATVGRVPPMIATLAVAAIARGLALLVTAKSVLVPLSMVRPLRFTASIFTTTTVLWILLAGLFAWALAWTRTGRHLYAIGGNEGAARLAGIRVAGLKIATYALAGGLSGLAGVLFVIRSSSGVPHVAAGWELDTIAGIVIGGTALFGGEGNIIKAMIGILIYQAIGNIMNLVSLSPYYQAIVKAAVVVAVVGISVLHQSRRRAAA